LCHDTAAAGASPHVARRHFTSTKTTAPASRHTRSISPSSKRTLRSTTVRPADRKKRAAASSAAWPSARRTWLMTTAYRGAAAGERVDRTIRVPTAFATLGRDDLHGETLVHGAELVLGLLIAVAALVTIARRLGIAYPVFLVIGGLVLGLVPGVPHVEV